MAEADLVITLGRKLDYQLGFGSPAVFSDARFLRVADTPGELIDNRRGTPEILASVDLALGAMTDLLGNDAGGRDDGWATGLQAKHQRANRKGCGPYRAANRRRWPHSSDGDVRGHRAGGGA